MLLAGADDRIEWLAVETTLRAVETTLVAAETVERAVPVSFDGVTGVGSDAPLIPVAAVAVTAPDEPAGVWVGVVVGAPAPGEPVSGCAALTREAGETLSTRAMRRTFRRRAGSTPATLARLAGAAEERLAAALLVAAGARSWVLAAASTAVDRWLECRCPASPLTNPPPAPAIASAAAAAAACPSVTDEPAGSAIWAALRSDSVATR